MVRIRKNTHWKSAQLEIAAIAKERNDRASAINEIYRHSAAVQQQKPSLRHFMLST
jgi:hypothetical protein